MKGVSQFREKKVKGKVWRKGGCWVDQGCSWFSILLRKRGVIGWWLVEVEEVASMWETSITIEVFKI